MAISNQNTLYIQRYYSNRLQKCVKYHGVKVEAFHYNTTNQCNHYVTELFDIKICYAKQKLKSIKKTIIKIGQAVSEISLYLCFGPH